MLFYFDKRVDVAQVGTRFMGVECEHCGFQYFYQLARVGSGTGVAPYGIGIASAKTAAREQSDFELARRLAAEAELVPCPKCNWINEELIRGYRLSRFRNLGMWALGIAFFGTFASLLCAWIVAVGPPADRDWLRYFLVGGPTLFVSVGLAMVLFRSYWRRRIQPNLEFPRPPRLPPGSPPALLLDERTGELEPAKPQIDLPGTSNEWFEFQLGRHRFPGICCECLKAASKEQAFKQLVAKGVELEVPRCGECARKTRHAYIQMWLLTFAVALMTSVAVLFFQPLDRFAFLFLFATCFVLALAVASYIASIFSAPIRLGGGDQGRGIIRLRFPNPRYREYLE